MPLTETDKAVMSAMRKQCGDKKGEGVFYASINKHKAGSSKWHLKGEHIHEAAKKMRGK